MSAIKTTAELRDVSFTVRNLLKSGIPAGTALTEAGKMEPKFRVLFEAGAHQIETNGWRLSQALAPIFPESVMPAVIAGEESGKVVDVMTQIWSSAKTQIEIDKVLKKLRIPAILIGVGVLISLAFFIFLIPFMYSSMSQTAPPDFDPGVMITTAVSINSFVMANQELVGIVFLGSLMGLAFLMTRQAFKEAAVDYIIKAMVKIKPIGVSYSQLKFGVVAQYLEIVSLAGLDADKRIDLVMDILPIPLRSALVLFRADMFNKGLAVASQLNEANPDDPRNNPVLWPSYMRLAFAQANEGSWEEPMREFGTIMIIDGQEKLQNHIAKLNLLATILVGVLVILPLGLLYATMGKILTMSMQML